MYAHLCINELSKIVTVSISLVFGKHLQFAHLIDISNFQHLKHFAKFYGHFDLQQTKCRHIQLTYLLTVIYEYVFLNCDKISFLLLCKMVRRGKIYL